MLVPAFGALSDVVGRKPLLIGSAISFVLLSYPLFAIDARGLAGWALAAQLLFAVLLGAYIGPAMAMVAEIFPTRVRYTGDSVALNIAFAVFGGTAPLIATFLIKQTGVHVSPAYYLIAAGAVSLMAILLTRETYHESLG
jgi:MHS family proline/betaine transporter-like MFS transporter